MKKAIIADLDNTIYPVSSIGPELFKPVFDLIADNGYENEIEDIKTQMMRIPFQKVAKKYKFDETLIEKGSRILSELAYDGDMQPFDDYAIFRVLPLKKYLLTMGFTKMQQAKVDAMNLDADFDEVYIADPQHSNKTKKDIIADIMQKHHYLPEEVLVIGDDAESEIKAALELGIDAVLYDHINANPDFADAPRIVNFGQLHQYL